VSVKENPSLLYPSRSRGSVWSVVEGFFISGRRLLRTADGYPLTALYGEQGPQIAGWLDRTEPRWAEGLHLLEASVRWTWALAILLEVAGPGAEEQVGKISAPAGRGGGSGRSPSPLRGFGFKGLPKPGAFAPG
jgi:hypothetical protein